MLTRTPYTQIDVDRDRIMSIEIRCLEGQSAGMTVNMARGEPQRFAFPDKTSAIDFYREVWLLRSREMLEDEQIEQRMT